MKDKSILETDFNNNLNLQDKDNYNWIYEKLIIDDTNIFIGENKKDFNKSIYIMQIIFSFVNNYNNNRCINILKEIYFLIFFKNYNYFIKLDDILLLDKSNEKRLFLIFRENCVDLRKLIHASNSKLNYLENKDLIKWIIYQIAFGLYTLHNNNIIHNDIKPSNIYINREGGITLGLYHSLCYKGEKSNLFSRPYSPPEFLLDENIIRDEKSDMWALGVIILELLLKKSIYFKINEQEYEENKNTIKEKNRKQLNLIFSKFGIIIENKSNEELNKIINDNDSNKDYNIQLTNDEIEKINDKDALELINNLLVLNKNKRYSAEQVINSNYLKEYYQCFTELDLPNIKNTKNILDYNNDYKKYFTESNIDEEKFNIIYKDLYSKLKEFNESK